MSKRLALFITGLMALAAVCTVALGKEMIRSRPQPGPSEIGPATSAAIARTQETPARAQSGPSPRRDDAASIGSSPVDVIVSGDLFDPSGSSARPAPGPTGPRPLLYGVVVGGGVKSRAYIEDPVTKVVRGYQIGDTVAGWRLEQIREDRVVISGAELRMMEVPRGDPVEPGPALLGSAEVAAEARIVASAAVEAQRIEPALSPAGPASAPREYSDAVPRIVGPIPSQLFRPARAQKQE